MARSQVACMLLATVLLAAFASAPTFACGCSSQGAQSGSPKGAACGSGSQGAACASGGAAKPASGCGSSTAAPTAPGTPTVRDSEVVHVVLGPQGVPACVTAQGVLSFPNPTGEQATGSTILQKRVPRSVQLTNFRIAADPRQSPGKPTPTVKVQESVTGQYRLYSIEVQGLPSAVPEAIEASGGCNSFAGGKSTVITYSASNILADSKCPVRAWVSTNPRILIAGKTTTIKLTGRVQAPAGATGLAQFAIPDVLAGGLVKVYGAASDAVIAQRSPNTTVVCPLKSSGEAAGSVFSCNVDVTPSVSGTTVLGNVLEVRLTTAGLEAAQLAPADGGSPGVGHPASRMFVLYAPLELQVRSH